MLFIYITYLLGTVLGFLLTVWMYLMMYAVDIFVDEKKILIWVIINLGTSLAKKHKTVKIASNDKA